MSELSMEQGRSLLGRTIAILMHPARAWPAIAQDEPPSSSVLNTHVIPLALIWPLAGTIGALAFGKLPYGFGFAAPAGGLTGVAIISAAMIVFIGTLASLMAIGVAANSLAPRFGGKSNFDRSFALIAYSATPVLLVGFVALVPQLSWLAILGVYGARLFWLGAPVMLDIPPARATGFTLALGAVSAAMNVLISVIAQLNITLIQAMGLT